MCTGPTQSNWTLYIPVHFKYQSDFQVASASSTVQYIKQTKYYDWNLQCNLYKIRTDHLMVIVLHILPNTVFVCVYYTAA